MLNENAKKWVAALRSGEYKQAKTKLAIKGEGHCCLGVACELFRKEGNAIDVHEREGIYRTIIVYDRNESILPCSVQQWLGLVHPNGGYRAETGDCKSLSQCNDDGATFDEIAAIIESEPSGLFTNEEAHEIPELDQAEQNRPDPPSAGG